jgi:hypothetical protein
MSSYPMARRGGLFLTIMGAALLFAILFSGAALVNYNVFFVGVGIAVVSLFASGHLSTGSPTRLQFVALAFALGLEFILLLIMGRTLPRGTAEQIRWLWISLIVGIHFLPMALTFGPIMLALGSACIANAVLGLLFPTTAYEVFGIIDGGLKLGFGLWLLAFKE